MELTLEQEFQLKKYKDQIKDLTELEAKEYLEELFRLMMMKDNFIKGVFKNV